ncbi:MAG: hypothetical protein JSS27_10605 [Planctomycetes bacterium]|nr:hypothetical protein [Planctomycetota bacterium]
MVTVSRVTIIADSALEQRILDECLRLGAKGYNVVPCRGKGTHAIIGDQFHNLPEEVRIELLVQADIGKKIFAWLKDEILDNHAVMAYLDEVQISPSDNI